MFPFTHTYILDRAIYKLFHRDLNPSDAQLILGNFLLDIIVNGQLRSEGENVQKWTHEAKYYDPTHKVQAGILFHLHSDHLANYNTLDYSKSSGFVKTAADRVQFLNDASLKDEDMFRRRIIQSGLDMLVIDYDKSTKNLLKTHIGYAVELLEQASETTALPTLATRLHQVLATPRPTALQSVYGMQRQYVRSSAPSQQPESLALVGFDPLTVQS